MQVGIDLVEAGTLAPLRGPFRWEEVVSFVLEAGETYVIATLILGPGDKWTWNPVSGSDSSCGGNCGMATADLTVGSGLTLGSHPPPGSARFECCSATVLQFPTQTDLGRQTFFGANLEYEVLSAPVPISPWAVGVLGVLLSALALRAGDRRLRAPTVGFL